MSIDAISLVRNQTLILAIDAQVDMVATSEINLDRGYAALASLLARCKASEAWRVCGNCESFNGYLKSLQEKFHRSTKQLYAYVGVAEKLLGTITEKQLDQIGITKALEIKRASDRAQKSVTKEILEAALKEEVTVTEIRALCHQVYELQSSGLPLGTYFDFGGAYLSGEEKKVFVEAIQVAIRVLRLPKEMPDHVKRKKIFIAFAQEFAGTHSAEAYGKEQ